MNWETVTKTKLEGGLGITDLESRNLAMMGKNWWHIKENKNNIWCKFLRSKYGTSSYRWINNGENIVKSTFMKNLSHLQLNSSTSKIFNNNLYYWKAHKGDRVLFWEDTWVQDTPLATFYPRLYRNCRLKNKTILDTISF